MTVGVYVAGDYEPKAGEQVRSLVAYKKGETEGFKSVKIIGDHINAAVVQQDYEAKKVKVEVAGKVVAVDETAATASSDDTAPVVRRPRRRLDGDDTQAQVQD